MKKEIANSRRNFLGTLALLSSGTLLAGSPSNLFDSSNAGNASLKKNWAAFLEKYEASGFINLSDNINAQSPVLAPGHTGKAGEVVSIGKENLLAQPTWIYWEKNSSHPDDVLVNLLEASYPYKRVRTINRFELQALVQLPAEKQLVKAICVKPGTTDSDRLNVKTIIEKRRNVQDVMLTRNNDILFTTQFLNNV